MNHKKGGGFLNLETTLKYAANHFSAGEPHDIASKSAVEYDQTTKISVSYTHLDVYKRQEG